MLQNGAAGRQICSARDGEGANLDQTCGCLDRDCLSSRGDTGACRRSVADPSGHGEGEILLFEFSVPLSGGAESFDVTNKLKLDPPAAGNVLTATATAPDGSTSEFSACFVVPVVEALFSDSFE